MFLWIWLEVLTVVTMKMAVLCVAAPCRLVWVYRRFRGLHCLHLRDNTNLHGAITQKTAIFRVSVFSTLPHLCFCPVTQSLQVLIYHIKLQIILIFLDYVIALSDPKLKSNGVKAASCLKSFRIRNASEEYILPTYWTVPNSIYTSFNISLNSAQLYQFQSQGCMILYFSFCLLNVISCFLDSVFQGPVEARTILSFTVSDVMKCNVHIPVLHEAKLPCVST
jgi:hypothetical protein